MTSQRILDILVIGAGSIGCRHAANLAALGARIHLYDVAQERVLSVCKDKGYKPLSDLDQSIKTTNYSGAIVCTPPHFHISVSQKLADAGVDLFIEKPLSHSRDGVDHLIKTVRENDLVAMSGFNLRFEPGLQYIKRKLDVSKVAFALIECGSHLPLWRPNVDYRSTYSAHRDMGGGIILDDVHELDYACWLFGYPNNTLCSYGQFSSFDIDVEDTADFRLIYPNRMVSIHSDYIQRSYTRKCKICMRNGYVLEWVFGDHVTEQHPEGDTSYFYKDGFNVNDMYIEEMKVFLSCINGRTQPESDLSNASRILNLALEAKSMNEGVFPR